MALATETEVIEASAARDELLELGHPQRVLRRLNQDFTETIYNNINEGRTIRIYDLSSVFCLGIDMLHQYRTC